jgi:hypothetical protein
VAWLAETLEVGLVPEQRLVALVLALVVSNELGRVSVDLAASGHLAREVIIRQDFPPQLLPTRRLVPAAMRLIVIAPPVSLSLSLLAIGGLQCA